MIDFKLMSKREIDELGFLYEQRYGPYKNVLYLLDEKPNQRIATCLKLKNIGLGPITNFKVENFVFTNHIGEKCLNLYSSGSEGYTKELMEIGYEFTMPIEIDFKLPPIGKIDS